jgi:hypothetical protein
MNICFSYLIAMIKVSFAKIFKVLVIIFFTLFTIHVIFYAVDILTYSKNLVFLESLALFNMNDEQNIPTLYNTFITLLSALLLVLIASKAEIKRDKLLWGGMALIFLYIGVDDFVTFHEGVYHHFVPEYSGTGFLTYGWVIPYGAIILIVLVIYIPHVIRIPWKVRNKIILAGAVFVTCAYVLEFVSGYFITHGHDILYKLSNTIGQGGEMVGILIFINALIIYIKLKFNTIAVQL